MSTPTPEEIERAVFRLLLKFHRETECGKDGLHWAECEALVDACRHTSWESWAVFEQV